MKFTPLLKVGLLLAVCGTTMPGCGAGTDENKAPADQTAPVVDPANSKDGIERTKHFET